MNSSAEELPADIQALAKQHLKAKRKLMRIDRRVSFWSKLLKHGPAITEGFARIMVNNAYRQHAIAGRRKYEIGRQIRARGFLLRELNL